MKKVGEEKKKEDEDAGSISEQEPVTPPPAEEVVEVEDADVEDEVREEKKPESPEDNKLVLSGFVRGADEVDGKPAILDVPAGKGRVILFAFNPLHRYLTLSDFRFVYNVLLNWNDLP
jgi:hypothetical protein